jgi:hypothetical protein
MRNTFIAGIVIAAAASAAHAATVQVDVVGSVDFNGLNFGQFRRQVAPSGTPATMSFQMDSDVFLNGSFPTRGYPINPASFTLTIGAASTGMPNPYPVGDTPYFILRDNDPAVDGFLLGSHPDVGFPNGVWTAEPAAIDPTFHALFHATYGGSTLSSLDILDAVGSYDFTGLTVFNWGLDDAGNQPLGLIFDYFTISVIPSPASASLFLCIAAAGTRRRR